MIQFRDFTPSDAVLSAIRSLRSDDDGMEPLERSEEISEAPMVESQNRATNLMAGSSGLLTTGRYLRAKV